MGQIGWWKYKKFHTIATQVFRNNYISFLLNSDNNIVHGHEQKTAILWQSLKDRIYTRETTIKNLNIDELASHEHLQDLEKPFTKEEVDEVIKSMPNDKWWGPDGFNGLLLRKCHHTIKESFYKLI